MQCSVKVTALLTFHMYQTSRYEQLTICALVIASVVSV